MKYNLQYLSLILFITSLAFASTSNKYQSELKHRTGFESSFSEKQGSKLFSSDKNLNRKSPNFIMVNGVYVLIEEITDSYTPFGDFIERRTYSYDDVANNTGLMVYDWENNNWLLRARSTSTFDENGNVIELLRSFWEEGQWVLNYNAFLTYNEFNNQTGTLGYGWDGTNWNNTTRITFTYDENQNNIHY